MSAAAGHPPTTLAAVGLPVVEDVRGDARESPALRIVELLTVEFR